MMRKLEPRTLGLKPTEIGPVTGQLLPSFTNKFIMALFGHTVHF